MKLSSNSENLVHLSDWVKSNLLRLNVKKTHFMIFSNSISRKNDNLTLNLNSEEIKQTHEARFLGVIIDDWLTFNSHRAAISVRPEIRFRFRPIRPFFFNPVPVPVPADNWPDWPD